MEWRNLVHPEYALRPIQYARRLRVWRAPTIPALETIRLPWGLRIQIDPSEAIGWVLATRGIYETEVTEVLWRLTQPGDIAVDVGANFGYMASVFAARVGRQGRLFCFEPNPEVFRRLTANLELWGADGITAVVEARQAAVGAIEGSADLIVPSFFKKNQGSSFVATDTTTGPGETRIQIPMVALDDQFANREGVAIVKIDVQGREISVLHGMSNLLREGRVRHIVFEEERAYPADTHLYLKEYGFQIFGIGHRWQGVRCLPDRAPDFDQRRVPNYLATRGNGHMIEQLERGLWQSFGPRSLLKI